MLPQKTAYEPPITSRPVDWETVGARMLEPFEEGLFLLGTDGLILRSTKAASRMFGEVERDWSGAMFLSLLPQLDRARVKDYMDQALHFGSSRIKTQLIQPSGATFHAELYLVPANLPEAPGALACRIVDITHQKAVEIRLVAERNFTSRILDTVGALVIVMDKKGQIVRFNHACETVTGYSFAEVYGQPFWDFVLPPEQKAPVRDVFRQLAAGSFPNHHENDWIHRNGQRRLISWSNTCLLDDTGSVQYVIGTGIDMTERREAERALAAEKERLNVTLHSIGDGVITTDEQGRVTLLNAVAEQLTGWPSADAIGLPVESVFVVIDEETHAPLPSPVHKVLQSGETLALQNHTILISKEKQEYIIHDSAAPIRDGTGTIRGVVLVFRDTTYRSQLEAEYIRSQKLESLGLLAGGIAHDFNNLLMAISGNVGLALAELPETEPATRRLVDAEIAVQRARNLTKQLSMLARGGTPVRKPLDLRPVILESARLALLGSNIQCEFILDDDLWLVDADDGQIGQLVGNLVLNAEQSITRSVGKGTIRIFARNCPEGVPDGTPLPAGQYVEVAVCDDGPGIPANVLPRIFEPFFSTKRRGSGLGLTSSELIVRKHDGYLRAESTEGQGATFRFYLAASTRKSADVAPQKPEAKRGFGRILLLDDDPAVREVSADILRFLGYQVDCSENGDESVRKYAQAVAQGRPYRAVILDLTIPGGMGALETLQTLRSFDPDVRALVMSGYTNDPILADYRAHGFVGAVIKPFEVGDLAEALAATLASDETTGSR